MTEATVSEPAGPPVVHFPMPFPAYRKAPGIAAGDSAEQIVTQLTELLGGRVQGWATKELDRGKGAVEARLQEFAKQSCAISSMVWVGHGRAEFGSGDAVLVVPGPLEPEDADDAEVTAAEVARRLIDLQARRIGKPQPWSVVIIEACGAGRFVELLSAELNRRGGTHRLALIGAGDPEGHGHLGGTAAALRGVVGSLEANDTEVPLWAVVDEVAKRLPSGRGVVRSFDLGGMRIRRPGVVAAGPLDVYARLQQALAGLSEQERSHFARKGMGADFGEITWSFVGRHAERQRIAEHLVRGEGLLAVTGPAGSGKSAVLGNLLLRARPEIRAVLVEAGLLDDDPVTQVEAGVHADVVVHLSGLTTAEVIAQIAEATQVPIPPDAGSAAADRLVEGLTARGSRARIVADALDEARDADRVADLLRRLGQVACVVVGTRASQVEGPDHPAPDARDLLDRLAVTADRTLVVERDPAALRTYVEVALDRDLPTLEPETRRRVLAAVITGSGAAARDRERQFLYARLLVHELKAQQSLPDDARDDVNTLLAGTHRSIFAAAIRRLARTSATAVPLLAALAHARGRGMPRLSQVWSTAAAVVSPGEYSPMAIDAVLVEAAPYVRIDAESGQSVFRLAHRTFEEHFEAGRPTGEQQDVAAALLELASEHPDDLNPYLRDHFAAHVGAGGEASWQALAQAEDVLDALDPSSVTREVMSTAFGRFPVPPAIAATTLGARALRECAVTDRHGIRRLYAARAGTQLFPTRRVWVGTSDAWSVGAAVRRRTPVHLALTGHTGGVWALTAFAGPDGRAQLASGGADGSVRVWDPATGQQVGAPLTGHPGGVWAVTRLSGLGGRLLLASGGADGSVRVWDPATGRQVGAPLAGHPGPVRAVVGFDGPGGRMLLAHGGSDGSVRLWDPATGRQVGAPLAGHPGPVRALTGFTGPGGWLLLASGGADGSVRVWDPATGDQVGARWDGHPDWVWAVTGFAGPGGRMLLATGGDDGSVRVWDPATGDQVGAPWTGHPGGVRAVTGFAGPGGRMLLATGGDDGSVRVWDPATGDQVGAPWTRNTRAVWAVTSFTGPGRRMLLGSGGDDGSVRVWDPVTGGQVGPPLTGHTGWVRAVTGFSGPGGRLLLASGGADGSVRVWDPATWRQLHQLNLHESIYAMCRCNGDLVVGLEDGWARLTLPSYARARGMN